VSVLKFEGRTTTFQAVFFGASAEGEVKTAYGLMRGIEAPPPLGWRRIKCAVDRNGPLLNSTAPMSYFR